MTKRARQRWRDEPWRLPINGSVFTFTVWRSMSQKRPEESIRRLASPRGLCGGRSRLKGLVGALWPMLALRVLALQDSAGLCMWGERLHPTPPTP